MFQPQDPDRLVSRPKPFHVAERFAFPGACAVGVRSEAGTEFPRELLEAETKMPAEPQLIGLRIRQQGLLKLGLVTSLLCQQTLIIEVTAVEMRWPPQNVN